MQGRFDEARTRAQAGKHFWLERGMRMRVGGNFFDSGAVEVLAGDLAAADRELAEGIAILNEIGETGVLSTLAAMHAEVLFQLGRTDEMQAAIVLARKTGALNDIATQANWRWVAAMAAAEDGREEEARRLIDEAIAMLEPTDFLEMQASAFEALAHVELRAGRPDGWKAALERALDAHGRKGNLIGAQRVRDLLEKGSNDRDLA
jgi:tetratricopeptide (TPR) repeat protein